MSVTRFTAEELEALEKKTTFPRMFHFPLGVLLILSLATGWPVNHWAWQIPVTLVLSFFMFCWTSCFHETSHQTLCGSLRISLWLGRLLGTIMLVPYTVYREAHIRHHAYLNKPTDWELWPYSDPTTSKTFRRIYVWFDLLLGVFTAPYMYGRIFFHKDSPMTLAKQRATVRNEYIGIVLIWSIVLGATSYFGNWVPFLRGWFIPLMLAGLWQNGRKLTEHVGMASYDPLLGTRTVVGQNPVTRLCSFLNYDIFVHGPHHRFPRIAHDQLRHKMQEFIDRAPDQKFPLFSSYWQATLDAIPHMFRNPGVGMNVGAASPAEEKEKDIRNFVADVNLAVLGESSATESAESTLSTTRIDGAADKSAIRPRDLKSKPSTHRVTAGSDDERS